jgi:hypothetical protein
MTRIPHRWNGEGALFYPGNDAGSKAGRLDAAQEPRDGMEDYEYFACWRRVRRGQSG